MMRSITIAAMALASIAAAGCATMSEEECLTADWRGVGAEDGARGYAQDRFAQRHEDCARHGVAPDFSSWSAGYAQGLQTYCTPHNAARVGARGESYRGVCAGPAEYAFVSAFELGARYHDARSRLEAAHEEAGSIEHRLDRIRRDIRHARARLDDEELSDDERHELRDRIRDWRGERREARFRADEIAHSLYALELEEARRGAELDAEFPGARP